MKTETSVWPKTIPQLTPEQTRAREQFMLLWHQELPNKYGLIEKFNHGFPAKLPIRNGIRTLEVGAGLGEHLKYEDLRAQDYTCLEYREEFCRELRKLHPADKVFQGDIQERQAWPDHHFDRVIAIHVLEHLPDLPRALKEVRRLLKPGGFFDVVIPCDGEWAYLFARRISSQRLFEKTFKMDFTPIIRAEHLTLYPELMRTIRAEFNIAKKTMFPFHFEVPQLNLCAGLRLTPR